MFRLSELLIIWYWIIAPIGIGSILLCGKKNKAGILHIYIFGIVSSFSLYYILCMIFMRANSTIAECTAVFNILMLIICIVSFVKYRNLANDLKNIAPNKCNFWGMIFILLVLIQIIYVIITTSGIYGDDIFYVGSINDMVYDNQFYSASYGYGTHQAWQDADYKCRYTSWMPYLAGISMTTGLHPLIVVKTFMPVLVVALYYMVWWLFSEWLFDNNYQKKCIFGIFFALITWFSAYSLYTVSKRVILYPRNGKALLISVFLPFIFYLINLNRKYRWSKLQIVEIIIAGIASISCSLMALILIPAMIGCVSLIKAIRVKKIYPIYQGGVVCIPEIICGILVLAEIIVKV